MFKSLRTVATICCLVPVAPVAHSETADTRYQVVDSNVTSFAIGATLRQLPKAGMLPPGGYVRFLDGNYHTILIEHPMEHPREGGVRGGEPPPSSR